MDIRKLINKFDSDKEAYLASSYNETQLRNDFLDPLFELLGWDIKNNQGKRTNEREVILEEPLKQVSEYSKKPDYTFRLYSERKFFLEAKKPSIPIQTHNESAKQIRRYGFTAKLKISILSNFEYLIIFDTSLKVNHADIYSKGVIKKYHYKDYEDKFEEIKNYLGKDAVYSGEFDKTWKTIEDKINSFSIDNLFLAQINEWRLLLGTEIFKYQPQIKENLLNDYVQSYLNRILFLRVCEDRNLEEYETLLKFANENDFIALIDKFKKADQKYNSGLFDQFFADKIIENISSVFWIIIKQLYYPESAYSFSVFSSDILGGIYEVFLSESLCIDGSTLKLIKKPENIERDIVTTPVFIIHDILRSTVWEKCQNKTDKEILKMKFADISCGSGAFLLELFQYVNDILIDYFIKHNPKYLIQISKNTYKLPYNIKKELLLNCIFGIDKDYNAVEATKFGLLLKLLENEDLNSTKSNKPILPDLSNNIFYGNSLISEKDLIDKNNFEIINPFDFKNFKFDVIVGNPPYMKSEDMKKFTSNETSIYKQKFQSAYKQYDKYYLFIEQGLKVLNEEGVLGYIIPNKFTKVGSAINLRRLLSANKYLTSIVSFGSNQIFANKTTYTGLLVLSKKGKESFRYTEINDLNYWKVRKDENIIYEQIETAKLKNESWIFIPPYLKENYNKIINQSQPLSIIVGESNINNGIQTSKNEVFVIKSDREDENYIYFSKKNKKIKIEKQILKPYFETQRKKGQDKLNTYRNLIPNSYIIFPYKIINNTVQFIYIDELKLDYPNTYNYLISCIDILKKRDIKPEPKTKDEWYRYGRSQYLKLGSIPEKIIIGVMSSGEKYPIDFSNTLHTAGGTAGYCSVFINEDNPYSIYYLQAILNSKYLEWIIHLRGEVFRGGYISRGTKVLKDLPIRKIDFKNDSEKSFHDEIVRIQKDLINTQSEIDDNIGNKRKLTTLQKYFESKKEELENTLKKLYDLENEHLIPTIKELYEVN